MDRTELTDQFIYSNLMNAILSGELQEVVDFAYQIWQHPIKLIDPGYRFLASAPIGKIGDRHWDVHVDNVYTPIELVTECYKNDYRKKTLGGDGVTYIDWGVENPRLVGNITVDKSVVAFMSLCYLSGQTPDAEQLEWDKRILRIFCKACAAVLMNNSKVSMIYKTEYDSLISLLFSGRHFSDADKRYWETMSGMRLKPHFAVIAIAVSHNEHYGLEYFKAMLRPISAIIAYNFSDDFLYLLICGISSYAQYLTYCKNLTTVLLELGTRAGGGQLFDDINQLSQQLRCARSAYDIALKTGQQETIVTYDEVQQDVILYAAVSNLEKEDCLHSCLRKLKAYDESYNTQYYHTLQIYISCMCNSLISSERLYIHRNTLQYRLNKITEICDINLDDVDLCRKLMLSFMTMDLNERLGR